MDCEDIVIILYKCTSVRNETFKGSAALSKVGLEIGLGLGSQSSLLQDRLLLPLDSRRSLSDLARAPELTLADLLEMDLIRKIV